MAEAEEMVYVAVGKDVEESKSVLSWALQYFPDRKVGFVHVHQPGKTLSLSNWGGGVPEATRLGEAERRAIRELERKIMDGILDQYLLFCQEAGVQVEKLFVEMDDIGEGIVELVYQRNIKKLVMGVAANKQNLEGLIHLKSEKAKYVCQLVPPTCQIWFICNGQLIHIQQETTTVFDGHDTVTELVVETGESSLRRHPSCDSNQLISFESPEGSECELELEALSLSEEDNNLPHHTALVDVSGNNQISNQLGQKMTVAEESREDASKVSARHQQADKTAVESIYKARALESLYTQELKHRKEIEEELAKEKEKLKKMKKQWDEECMKIKDQKLSLEVQVSALGHINKDLENKCSSTEEMLKGYKKERDDLQIERDNALEVTEELLRKQTEDASGLNIHEYFSKFSYSEIQDATCDFDSSLQIGENPNGVTYKGLLYYTPVAIKMYSSGSSQGPVEFLQEVNVLSRCRHLNLVILIGVCPESCALIYEYLPNGSLKDRLSRKDNTPPLSWQTRVRIADEICSALIFLHRRGISHGDLEPKNILLDANFTCKLRGFGKSSNRTPMHDTYSFGVVVLQLLTGDLSVMDIMQEMETVIEEGNLNEVLDPLAGDWPFVQANQLGHLAMRCCKINQNNQSGLLSEFYRVLEPMRSSCGASSSSQPGPDERSNPPSYFICPIYQEVMQDPCVASDGYTYEEEALRGWLNSGHETSPMTNLRLEHSNLVPNRALRSAIQEWQHHHNQQQQWQH